MANASREIHVPSHSFLMRAIYRPLQLFFRLLFSVCFKFNVSGLSHVPLQGPCIFLANHASFLDPLFVGVALPRRLYFLMYARFFYSCMRPFFQLLGCIPLDEKRYREALKAGSAVLERGDAVCIFPEGAVSYDGELLKPRSGALMLAKWTGAPLLPVAIRGNHAVFPRGAWMPRFQSLSIQICKPVMVSPEATKGDLDACLNEIMRTMANRLNRSFSTSPPTIEEQRERYKGRKLPLRDKG